MDKELIDSQIKQAQETLSNTLDAVNGAKAQLETKEEEIVLACEKLEFITKSIAEGEDILHGLNEKVDILDSEATAKEGYLADFISAQQKELLNLSEEIQAEKEVRNDLSDEIDILQEKKLELQNEIVKKEAELEALEKENQVKISALEQSIESVSKDLSAVKDAVELQTKKLNDVNAEENIIRQRIEEDARLSISRVEGAEAHLADLLKEIEAQKTVLTNTAEELSLLNKHIQSAKDELADTQAQKTLIEKELNTTKELHSHVLRKEEYLRDKYEVIGQTYPEFK